MTSNNALNISASEVAAILQLAADGDTQQLETQLSMVARRENVDVGSLIAFIQDSGGNGIIHRAAESGSVSTINYLFSSSIFANSPGRRYLVLNGRNHRHETPAMMTVRYGHIDSLRLLHSYGAFLSGKNLVGETIVMIATRSNNLDIMIAVVTMLETEPSVNITQTVNQRNPSGDTALHIATRYGNLAIATYLVDRGGNISARSASGSTPLHVAAQVDDIDMANFLMNRGADMDEKNRSGLSPWNIACENALSEEGRSDMLDTMWARRRVPPHVYHLVILAVEMLVRLVTWNPRVLQ